MYSAISIIPTIFKILCGAKVEKLALSAGEQKTVL
jgi:hypothetical protein